MNKLLSVWSTLSTLSFNWRVTGAALSEFVSSSIPSWQILTAHAQPFRRARDLALCLKVALDSPLVWASSGGSGETARMRRLAWTFAARIGDKYQIRLARPTSYSLNCTVHRLSVDWVSDEWRSSSLCLAKLGKTLDRFHGGIVWLSFNAPIP